MDKRRIIQGLVPAICLWVGSVYGVGNELSKMHLSGYAVGEVEKVVDGQELTIAGEFSPIFKYTYGDLALVEAEIELTTLPNRETKAELEFGSVTLFMGDYLSFTVGKFLSPIGFFQRNLHPAWINKMATKPLGFGEGGAAPLNDIGILLQGVAPLGSMRLKVAVYAGNGPSLKPETATELELEMEGNGSPDPDLTLAGGGRVALVPTGGMEIGISAGYGKPRLVEVPNGGPGRRWLLYGADLTWNFPLIKGFQITGEFLKNSVDGVAKKYAYSDPIDMTAWYAQLAYRLPIALPMELVARYGQFEKGEEGEGEEHEEGGGQIALGINYLYSTNVMAKTAFQLTGDEKEIAFQLAYGF